MKRDLVTLIVVLVCIAIGLVGVLAHAEPMTPERVKQMIADPWSWIADLYNATPTVTMPDLRGIATGSDFSVSMTGPVVVSVSDKLKYNLSMGPWLFSGDVPRIDPWKLVEAGGIGFLVGVVTTIAVEFFTDHLK